MSCPCNTDDVDCLCLLLQFDGVLENVSQDTVYNTCAHDAVDSVLAGVNACVFCYGQVSRLYRWPAKVTNHAANT
jgi:hypothetical protein